MNSKLAERLVGFIFLLLKAVNCSSILSPTPHQNPCFNPLLKAGLTWRINTNQKAPFLFFNISSGMPRQPILMIYVQSWGVWDELGLIFQDRTVRPVVCDLAPLDVSRQELFEGLAQLPAHLTKHRGAQISSHAGSRSGFELLNISAQSYLPNWARLFKEGQDAGVRGWGCACLRHRDENREGSLHVPVSPASDKLNLKIKSGP